MGIQQVTKLHGKFISGYNTGKLPVTVIPPEHFMGNSMSDQNAQRIYFLFHTVIIEVTGIFW